MIISNKRINIFTNEIRLYSYTYRHIFYLLVERWSFPLDAYWFFDLQSKLSSRTI